MNEKPKKWKSNLKKHFNFMSTRFNSEEATVAESWEDFGSCEDHVAVAAPSGFATCVDCGLEIPKGAKFSAHMHKVHGRRAPERVFASPSGICGVCLKIFGIRPRLLIHLSGKHSQGSFCSRQCFLSLHRSILSSNIIIRLTIVNILKIFITIRYSTIFTI